MYKKYELDKYFIDGELIDTPIYTKVDLNQCDTDFFSDSNGNMTGFIFPFRGKSGKCFALFVSDTPSILLHDGNCSIDCPDSRFDYRCWYIGYSDYLKFVKQQGFIV